MKLSITDYAQLCGVSRSAIYDRERKGQLEIIRYPLPTGGWVPFVDTDKYPPVEKMKDSGKVKVKQ